MSANKSKSPNFPTPNFPWKIRLLLFMQGGKTLGGPNKHNLSMDELRQISNKNALVANKVHNKKVEVKYISDHEANGQKLRVYRNSDALDQKVILYFHGGGMAFFDLEAQDFNCRRMCVQNNCVVVNANYRLAPENTFPAAHDDAAAMLHWINDNCQLIHADAAKVVTMGDSAGANLAGFLAYYAKKNDKVQKLLGQVLIYPWVDINTAQYQSAKNYGNKNYILSNHSIEFFTNAYLPDPRDHTNPDVNLIMQKDFSNLPPTLILTAQCDILCDQGISYGEKLLQSGNKVTSITYPNAIHGFFSFLNAQFSHSEPLEEINRFMEAL